MGVYNQPLTIQGGWDSAVKILVANHGLTNQELEDVVGCNIYIYTYHIYIYTYYIYTYHMYVYAGVPKMGYPQNHRFQY